LELVRKTYGDTVGASVPLLTTGVAVLVGVASFLRRVGVLCGRLLEALKRAVHARGVDVQVACLNLPVGGGRGDGATEVLVDGR
jgi:hypothetical protein